MAKYSNGINGPFIGKVGNVVGTTWKGIPVLRAAPIKRTSRAKGNEKQNQSKFAMAHYWLQPLLDFVREGFKDYSFRSSGFNAAKSYLLNNAFEGTSPAISINPALVKLSAGVLPLPHDIAAAKIDNNFRSTSTIEFTWDTSNNEHGNNYDQAMVAAYNIEKGRAFTFIYGQFRSAGSHKLNVPAGETYHLYIAFTSGDRSMNSDSVYLGALTV